tara:strand:- start:3078 stop:3410 length:333 start_codon:yes stop_codon:yes gene_type:complete
MKLLYILLLTPTFLFGQLLNEKDKQLHFAAGMLTGAAGYTFVYSKTQDKKLAIAGGFVTSLAAGIAKEYYDNQNGGKADPRDILATSLGGLSVSVTIPLFTNNKKKRRNK